MPRRLTDVHDQHLALIDRLIHELAAERGLDGTDGLPATERHRLAYDAEVLCEQWVERVQDGEIITPSTPVEILLAEIYDLETASREAETGGGAID